MGKTIRRNDSETRHKQHRNYIAAGMIEAGTGHAQVFRDRRARRLKDARHQKMDRGQDY